MKNGEWRVKRGGPDGLTRVIGSLLLIVVAIVVILAHQLKVRAAELTLRNISVSSGQPGISTTHTYNFTFGSTSVVGSIVFRYCENTPVYGQTCDPPVGLDLSGAVLSSQSGNTGFSIDTLNSNANTIVLTRTPGSSVAVASSYVFDSIVNPTNAPHSEFIQISTHASTNGSGARIDEGSVAYAVNTTIDVSAYVPPFLNFCVGVSVALDCTSTVGNSIDLGTISKTAANSATSQFSTATNDPSGYVVYALGNTMTSGNNIIPALAAPLPNVAGSSQFGLNLRSNTSPSVGQDPFGVGTGLPTLNYNFPNFYTYNSGDSLASSTLSSDYTRMTVSYLVNAAGPQPPGVYSTTITYLATVSF